ncbi:hypothetical protein SLS62_005812 [Diatrype stigma]|uniref:Uncharacterized protein n=1 Tax=Diatrype stigma TaxID=117547 RepID=A0AAN9UQN6_9PEZI
MQPLVSVNTNNALISITIAPSIFIASLTIALVFLYSYLLSTGGISLRKPSSSNSITPWPRIATESHTPPPLVIATGNDRALLETRSHKTLPALPAPPPERRLLRLTEKPHSDDSEAPPSPVSNLRSWLFGPKALSPAPPLPLPPLPLEEKKRPAATAYEAAATRHPFHQPPGGDSMDMDDVQFKTPMSPPPLLGHLSSISGYPFSDPDLDQVESDDSSLEEDDDDGLSAGGYSPPAWRRLGNGNRSSGFWRQNENHLAYYRRPSHQGHHQSHSRSPSSFHPEDEEVLEQAIRTRLPTGSLSPEKGRTPDPDARGGSGSGSGAGEDDTLVDHVKSERGSTSKGRVRSRSVAGEKMSIMGSMPPEGVRDNYIRFAVRADIQQRTEPIETAINFFRSKIQIITKSWGNIIVATLVAILSLSAVRSLFQPAQLRPVPDLVKVAGLARSFEPLIYYSENGVSQIGDLQATGVAVWDLSESVRSSNMTSAPIIVKSLDELSDSLKTLAIELTKFFANVDGDIDGILIVMDWARRELTQVQAMPSPPLSTAFSNIHNLLCAAGLLENPATGLPTRLGSLTTHIFGMSQPQRARSTLQRTFAEFLAVLEEAIESELQHSLALFALFEAIDRQFLNLARTVAREASLQEAAHADLLASLWTRILGARAGEVAKYERNRSLLRNVREKTVRNKGLLVEHNGKLLTLKANLETLRRKLVSPLVRGGGGHHHHHGASSGSTLSIETQVRGLEDVGGYLEGVRARQKAKLMEMLYGSGGSHAKLSYAESSYGAGGGAGGAAAATPVDAAERNARIIRDDDYRHHHHSGGGASWAS